MSGQMSPEGGVCVMCHLTSVTLVVCLLLDLTRRLNCQVHMRSSAGSTASTNHNDRHFPITACMAFMSETWMPARHTRPSSHPLKASGWVAARLRDARQFCAMTKGMTKQARASCSCCRYCRSCRPRSLRVDKQASKQTDKQADRLCCCHAWAAGWTAAAHTVAAVACVIKATGHQETAPATHPFARSRTCTGCLVSMASPAAQLGPGTAPRRAAPCLALSRVVQRTLCRSCAPTASLHMHQHAEPV